MKQTAKNLKTIICGLAAAVFASVTLIAPTQIAHASSFNPGRIIDDAVFYDGNAMTAGQVQAFLNEKVPYGTQRSLRNYSQQTAGKLPDRYCRGGYVGSANESAAEIIAKVGKSCDISQKVLLVMLQKEQSLITVASPSNYAYERAMGYACPDSGPNFSANCDAAYFGFANQVWHAARQFKVYRDSGQFGWFPVGRASNLQYHPNINCGTKWVVIENSATAGLYYYTPYTPNNSVLQGNPDNCAAYGNFNFHKLYTNWFGKAVTVTIDKKFEGTYNANPALYGAAVANALTLTNGVVEQRFEHATLYWHPHLGVSSVRGAIRQQYDRNKGADGVYGIPLGVETNDNGMVRQNFMHGVGFWTPQTGAGLLRAGFWENYLLVQNNLPQLLGAPYDVEQKVADGSFQRFRKGYMFWSHKTGVNWVRDDFAKAHQELGGAAGKLGFPKAVEETRDGYIIQEFEHGVAYNTPQHGVATLHGAIYAEFKESGELERFGFPTSSEVSVTGGVKQEFTNVTAYWGSASGVGYVFGGIRGYYNRLGAENSFLGLPVKTETTGAGYAVQEFQHGYIFWTPQGVYTVGGAISGIFRAQGGIDGEFGLPLTNEIKEYGGVRQEFQYGTAYWSPRSGAGFITGAVRDAYYAAGGVHSYLGYPVGGEISALGFARQEFEHGTAIWTAQNGVVFVKGAIRGAFLLDSSSNASFGYPITDEIAELGGVRQEFTKGTVYWSPATGASFITGAIRETYRLNGGSTSYLGYPLNSEITAPGRARHDFKNATVYWSNRGITVVKGAIRGAYFAAGAESGIYGYPVTSEINQRNGVWQEFERVIVTWTPEHGVTVQQKP